MPACRARPCRFWAPGPKAREIIGQRFVDKKLTKDLLPQVSEALQQAKNIPNSNRCSQK